MLTKITAKTAAEICGDYRLSQEAEKLLREDLTPAQFIDRLTEASQYRDMFDFLAHALPMREAIWWACLSIRHTQGPKLPPKEFAVLKAAVEWVLEPDEAKRQAALATGKAAGFRTPAGLAACAVIGTGASIVAADLPVVPPAPYMTAQTVSASIVLASSQSSPETLLDVERELVELGLAIAEGKIPCPTKRPAPA